MSVEPDKSAGCPTESDKNSIECGDCAKPNDNVTKEEKKKISRSVRFPDEEQIVTQYFEPANPWHDGKTPQKSLIYYISSNIHDRLLKTRMKDIFSI